MKDMDKSIRDLVRAHRRRALDLLRPKPTPAQQQLARELAAAVEDAKEAAAERATAEARLAEAKETSS